MNHTFLGKAIKTEWISSWEKKQQLYIDNKISICKVTSNLLGVSKLKPLMKLWHFQHVYV